MPQKVFPSPIFYDLLARNPGSSQSAKLNIILWFKTLLLPNSMSLYLLVIMKPVSCNISISIKEVKFQPQSTKKESFAHVSGVALQQLKCQQGSNTIVDTFFYEKAVQTHLPSLTIMPTLPVTEVCVIYGSWTYSNSFSGLLYQFSGKCRVFCAQTSFCVFSACLYLLQ